MKNFSISKKLIVGFGLVLLMLLLSVALSIFSINNIGGQINLYGQYTVPNAEHLRSMQVNMQNILHLLTESMLEDDAAIIKENLDSAAVSGETVKAELKAYQENQRNTDRDADIQKISALISEAAASRASINELLTSRPAGYQQMVRQVYMNEYRPKIDETLNIMMGFSTTAKERASIQFAEADNTTSTAYMLLVICGAASIVISVLIIAAIRRSILNPVREIVSVFEEISKGNLKAQINYQSRDELGRMALLIQQANAVQSGVVGDVMEKFQKIAEGDMRIHVDADYPGDFYALKETIERTASMLNKTMHAINAAAEQVSMGSEQVASGAQALASGSTEQASSIEELSASVSIIAEQAAQNTEHVDFATQSLQKTAKDVGEGNAHMQQLSDAMADIGDASNKIANITKVIEDIAFQTNILALNAAIEAARAGTAGKGFAVVADEVRTLASKSQEAAKQTADLIQHSVDTVTRGEKITAETAGILDAVGSSTKELTDSFAKIEQASTEQAGAIEQIKLGLDQVSTVIQTNAATAEENSATSEEMSAQAVTLRQEVAKFKLSHM